MDCKDALFDTNTKSNDKTLIQSPVEEFFGPALYVINCREAKLFVHEKAVVIYKANDGFWDAEDACVRVVPYKSIVAVDARIEDGFMNGYLVFETANYKLDIGNDGRRFMRQDYGVTLGSYKEYYNEVKDALKYIFSKIV